MTSRALVLGGGGVAGIAWEIGVLHALHTAGVDVADADLVVGTSAGAAVGTVLRAGIPLADLLARQLADADAEDPDAERPPKADLAWLAAAFASAVGAAADPADARRRVGSLALAAPTVPEADRLAVIARRIRVVDWPERPLRITALDTETGKLEVFDRDSGAPLVDAVAASCAVPGVWPPVTIGGRRYMDGGVRSTTNADLAAGHDRVLVVAPMPPVRSPLGGPLTDELAVLERTGRVLVVAADEESRAAFGANPLDPATRPASADAGRRQGADVVQTARTFWVG